MIVDEQIDRLLNMFRVPIYRVSQFLDLSLARSLCVDEERRWCFVRTRNETSKFPGPKISREIWGSGATSLPSIPSFSLLRTFLCTYHGTINTFPIPHTSFSNSSTLQWHALGDLQRAAERLCRGRCRRHDAASEGIQGAGYDESSCWRTLSSLERRIILTRSQPYCTQILGDLG